jgi:hypothetical protein
MRCFYEQHRAVPYDMAKIFFLFLSFFCGEAEQLEQGERSD